MALNWFKQFIATCRGGRHLSRCGIHWRGNTLLAGYGTHNIEKGMAFLLTVPWQQANRVGGLTILPLSHWHYFQDLANKHRGQYLRAQRNMVAYELQAKPDGLEIDQMAGRNIFTLLHRAYPHFNNWFPEKPATVSHRMALLAFLAQLPVEVLPATQSITLFSQTWMQQLYVNLATTPEQQVLSQLALRCGAVVPHDGGDVVMAMQHKDWRDFSQDVVRLARACYYVRGALTDIARMAMQQHVVVVVPDNATPSENAVLSARFEQLMGEIYRELAEQITHSPPERQAWSRAVQADYFPIVIEAENTLSWPCLIEQCRQSRHVPVGIFACVGYGQAIGPDDPQLWAGFRGVDLDAHREHNAYDIHLWETSEPCSASRHDDDNDDDDDTECDKQYQKVFIG